MANKETPKIKDRDKYDYAFLLYMQKVPQKEISEKVGVSVQTISKWKEAFGWELKRASKEVSIDQLIRKAMGKLDDMLSDDENFSADSFSKVVSQLKTLKKDTYIDDVINSLTSFGDWLIEQSKNDKNIDTAFVKRVTELQNMFILNRIKNGN